MDRLKRAIEFLAELLEPLRFFKHASERRERLERELREHTLEILEATLAASNKQAESQAQVAIETAKSSQALAAALHTWFEMFKSNADHEHLKSETVRPADEWDQERRREKERLVRLGYPVDGSSSEQMAFLVSMGEELPF